MGTVLEFYCGIGGLRFAYEMALDALPPTHPLKSATHIVSFDISEFLLFATTTQITHITRSNHPKQTPRPRRSTRPHFTRVSSVFVPFPFLSNAQYSPLHTLTQTNLEFVKPEQIERYNAAVWLLSPPCQPYNSCVNCLSSL